MASIELADKFRGIFNSTFTFIGFLDTDGILLEANNTAVGVAGLTHEDVIGKYFWDCYWWQSSAFEQERLRKNFAKALGGDAVTYEAEVLIKDGARITILFSLRPIKNNQGEVVFVIPEGCPIQELVDARTRMEAIIDGANAATWEWHCTQDEVIVDRRWAETLGYSLEQLNTLTLDQWLDFIHPDDRLRAREQLEACRESDISSYEVQYRVKHKSGEYLWVIDRAKLFNLAHDNQFTLLGTRQDISEFVSYQEQLRISEDAFSRSFHDSGIGMALVSTEGLWLKVNHALTELLGYEKGELLDGTFQDITHPDDIGADLNLLKETLAGDRDGYQMEKRYIHKQGHFIDAILCVSAVRDHDNHVLYFVSQLIDITERKQVERVKNEFIATVSHELRTPLTSIVGSIKLLLSDKLESSTSIPPHFRNLLNIALDNSERLQALVNDLLDIEKISARRMKYELKPLKLSDLIDQALSTVAHYGKHEIIKDFPTAAGQALVLVDGQRFVQVITNLLSNAIKFSSSETPIKISARVESSEIKLTVEDKGIGIPEAFIPHVFEKFSQADSGDVRQVKGTGLGLALSKALIEGMNGSIGCESVEGRGSTFWVLVPLSKA